MREVMEGERETADARAAAICACVRLRESSAIYTSDVCGEGERETSDTARVRSGGCEGVMEGACAEVGASAIRRVRGSNGGRASAIRRMRGSDGGRAREGGCEGGSDMCVCACVCVCVCVCEKAMAAEGDDVDSREASFCVCACATEQWRQSQRIWIRVRQRHMHVRVRGSDGGRARDGGRKGGSDMCVCAFEGILSYIHDRCVWGGEGNIRHGASAIRRVRGSNGGSVRGGGCGRDPTGEREQWRQSGRMWMRGRQRHMHVRMRGGDGGRSREGGREGDPADARGRWRESERRRVRGMQRCVCVFVCARACATEQCRQSDRM